MIVTGANGYRMIDHERSCAIKRLDGRGACTCCVNLPYVFATQNWEEWAAAPESRRAEMQAQYRATIRAEVSSATYQPKPPDPRLSQLHEQQFAEYEGHRHGDVRLVVGGRL
jgi:hypothetical protein